MKVSKMSNKNHEYNSTANEHQYLLLDRLTIFKYYENY